MEIPLTVESLKVADGVDCPRVGTSYVKSFVLSSTLAEWSPSTLTVYRQFTGPVHVNPNPKNFNDHDKLLLLNIKFKHSAYN